jgi:hypothetical protein
MRKIAMDTNLILLNVQHQLWNSNIFYKKWLQRSNFSFYIHSFFCSTNSKSLFDEQVHFRDGWLGYNISKWKHLAQIYISILKLPKYSYYMWYKYNYSHIFLVWHNMCYASTMIIVWHALFGIKCMSTNQWDILLFIHL